MVRKLVFGGIVGLMATGILLGTGTYSYLKTGVRCFADSIKSAVPIEVELQRVRDMIRDLQPEINKNMQTIAMEKVQVERLHRELAKIEEQLSSGKRDIERLHSDLSSREAKFVYAKRTYTSEQVREDLAARFKRFKTQEATASKVRQMLAARERSLAASRDRLEGLQSMKRQLEVEVENLQARLAAVEVAQTNSSMALDDSRLTRTRELIDEIKTRIDVQEELLSVDGRYDGTIQLEEPSESKEDLLDEIAAYFQGSGLGVELASKNQH